MIILQKAALHLLQTHYLLKSDFFLRNSLNKNVLLLIIDLDLRTNVASISSSAQYTVCLY
jgi:hypothetical protein